MPRSKKKIKFIVNVLKRIGINFVLLISEVYIVSGLAMDVHTIRQQKAIIPPSREAMIALNRLWEIYGKDYVENRAKIYTVSELPDPEAAAMTASSLLPVGKSRIFIITDNVWYSSDITVMTGILHHEFSHSLLAYYGFSWWKVWDNINAESPIQNPNPSSTKYFSKFVEEYPEGELRLAGYVTDWASFDNHEDFAENARFLFTYPEEYCQLRHANLLIAAKAQLVIMFYRKYVPGIVIPECNNILFP